MTGAAALDIRIDRKTFRMPANGGSRVAIEGLALSVPAAQFLCIVGPSGCGKTTLMNLIARLDREAEGTVQLSDGTPVESARIAYMFQTPRLLPWLSVRDNVRIVLDQAEGAEGRAEALLRQMELGDSLDDFPNRLSGGMQRRVALARAFVTEPQLLLLDEPFVSLDLPVGNRLRGLLLDLWRARPTTVVFVTHDLREAIYLADRIVFLSRGPSKVILDETVGLTRPRDVEDPAIDRFRIDLLERHSSLLHGLAGASGDQTPGAVQ
ncbi:MAG: ABC transporter ATP-binding protein [Alphaproteobacteria bacterium]|jgi:NitT/TauT family transport system ATP-binding protein|nr:ABC transporter ATP-binding protein [Alphaproteobacteria bacterium]MDP6516981.1 ABC transporter ATP-binding protein [Alphaproteobacteria bacterium]